MDILSLEIDPKFKKWLKEVYKDGELDSSFVYMCEKYKRLNDKIPIEYRDIYRFKSVYDFVSYVDSIESETDREEIIKKNGSVMIYENHDFIVKHITTYDAIKIYGKGTKWCISSETIKYWDDYINKGDNFFLVISKKLPYDSQFKKFIVQTTDQNNIIIWDRHDRNYHSTVLDLTNLSKSIFINHNNRLLINYIIQYINNETIIDILYNNNAIIAGGALKSSFLREKIKDIDIWFSNENDYYKAIDEFKRYYEDIEKMGKKNNQFLISASHNLQINNFYETKNSISFNIDGKTFQIIKPNRYDMGDVNKIISQFDFNCVMCGFNFKEKELVYHKNFFQDAKYRNLNINPTLRSPANLLNRIIKYTKDGYRISSKNQIEVLRILSKITENDIEDVSLY